MSFDEDQFCSLEEKVNIEDLVLPNDPTTSDENEALDQKIEIKEEIQETFLLPGEITESDGTTASINLSDSSTAIK